MIGRTNATFSIKGGYVRPLEWLQIEHLITEGEEKMVGLYAVWDAANVVNNYFNNYCTMVITGDCTVDWGDGTVENFASNAIAEHVYDYDDLPDSTICERGNKQVIITVTPQAGQHITQYNLGNKHSADIHYQSSSNWLDISISGTHISRILMYNNCKAIFLEKFKAYQQTTLCTNMSGMFFYCTSLQSIDLSSFNTSNVTTMSSMFNYCYSLQSIDLSLSNLNSITNNTLITNSNYTLSMCRLPNIPLSFSIENSNMDATNINALFTDLRDLTGFAQQTINVKGNPGAATCTTSIATDKNWIVITA
jgi:surface protein